MFPGASVGDWEEYRRGLERLHPVSRTTIDRLVDIYGSRAADILDFARSDQALLQTLGNTSDAIGAELVFTWQHEFARTLIDVLLRRTMIGLDANLGSAVVERAADILAGHLKWDRSRRDGEVDAYRRYMERFAIPAAMQNPAGTGEQQGKSAA